MPQRAVNLLLAAAGLAAVVALIVAGANVYRAARSGPKWKRRLFAAGLGLLGTLGFGATGCAPPRVTCYYALPDARSAQQKREDRMTSLSHRLKLLRKAAEAKTLESKVVLKELEAADHEMVDLDREVSTGMWPAAEKAEVERLLDQLKAEIGRLRREIELQTGTTCYDLTNFGPGSSRLWDSPEGRAERTALLNSLVEKGRIMPEVAARVGARLAGEPRGPSPGQRREPS